MSKLIFGTPDFDGIKKNLKEYLKSKDVLKDYDFDGSVLSAVLDTLSYNSHMNTFYLNMVGNEAFLPTAIRRESVVNAAYPTGYIPASARSAVATLYLEYEPVGDIRSSIVVPRVTMFNSMTDGVAYMFSTIDTHTAIYKPDINRYVVSDVDVYEGRVVTHEFNIVKTEDIGNISNVYDPTLVGCNIPNANVDTSIMRVSVQDPNVSTEYIMYSQFDGDINLTENSHVYFVNENELGNVVVRFGNDVIGKKPSVGSKVKIEYFISSGPKANGVAHFNQTTPIAGGILTKVLAQTPAAGGTFQESIESIKHNAPISFEAQNRGVISSDFEHIVRQIYPNIKDIRTWGGEDNEPPQFGKVFIAIYPNTGLTLPEAERKRIETVVAKKCVLTTRPVVVDPDYVLLDVTTKIVYDPQQSTAIGGELEQKIIDKIKDYGEKELSTFESSIRGSRFSAVIDSLDSGIVSNTLTLHLSKRVMIDPNNKSFISESFANKLEDGSLTSTRFSYSGYNNCRFGSFGKNGIAIYYDHSGTTSIIYNNAGTIDYETGEININPVLLKNVSDEYFDSLTQKHFIKISVEPIGSDITSNKNQILVLDNITVIGEAL